MFYTVFEIVTGRIQESGDCSEHDFLLQLIGRGENFAVIRGISDSDPESDYVENRVIQKRTTQPTTIDKATLLADGVDAVLVSNMPPSAAFTATNLLTGNAIAVEQIDGVGVIKTTTPGEIKIKIESWPYLDFELKITALKTLAQHIATAKAEINAITEKTITDRYSFGKQASMNSRRVELLAAGAVDSDEYRLISDVINWIKSRVDESNAANLMVDESKTTEEINTIIANFRANKPI